MIKHIHKFSEYEHWGQNTSPALHQGGPEKGRYILTPFGDSVIEAIRTHPCGTVVKPNPQLFRMIVRTIFHLSKRVHDGEQDASPAPQKSSKGLASTKYKDQYLPVFDGGLQLD